jgi:hypothetical protein
MPSFLSCSDLTSTNLFCNFPSLSFVPFTYKHNSKLDKTTSQKTDTCFVDSHKCTAAKQKKIPYIVVATGALMVRKQLCKLDVIFGICIYLAAFNDLLGDERNRMIKRYSN